MENIENTRLLAEFMGYRIEAYNDDPPIKGRDHLGFTDNGGGPMVLGTKEQCIKHIDHLLDVRRGLSESLNHFVISILGLESLSDLDDARSVDDQLAYHVHQLIETIDVDSEGLDLLRGPRPSSGLSHDPAVSSTVNQLKFVSDKNFRKLAGRIRIQAATTQV